MGYIPLSEEYCLLNMEDSLWIVKFWSKETKKQIWSIYTLVPEALKGSAEWTAPNSKTALRFDFDLPYDILSVSCEESTLYYIGSDNTIHTAHALEVPAESYFCWNPRNDSGALVDSASIQFILSGETNLIGTIYITADPQDPNTFTATVVGTNLYIERVGGGAVISLTQ